MSIEKFEGQFQKEELGVSILVNKTLRLIKSPDTLGVYCYLATLPNDWQINVKQLMSHFGVGKDKVYRILNDLISLNLLTVTQIREAGKFSKNVYKLWLRPCSPCPEKPDTVKPDAENKDTYKTNKNTKQINKQNNISSKREKPLSISGEIDDRFNEFWNAYPRKEKKKESKKVFKANNISPNLQLILDDLKRYQGKDKQYIPQPTAYLRGERWLDEIETKQQQREVTEQAKQLNNSDQNLRDAYKIYKTECREKNQQPIAWTDWCYLEKKND